MYMRRLDRERLVSLAHYKLEYKHADRKEGKSPSLAEDNRNKATL